MRSAPSTTQPEVFKAGSGLTAAESDPLQRSGLTAGTEEIAGPNEASKRERTTDGASQGALATHGSDVTNLNSPVASVGARETSTGQLTVSRMSYSQRTVLVRPHSAASTQSARACPLKCIS